ncbi:MAG: pirin family protein [Candidatus Woesearchaeota archaeon]
MTYTIQRAKERGINKLSWLDSHFSFSFANYYNPKRMQFGALRVLNDDIIAPASGFGMHPHDNVEVISVPIQGALTHEDSLGSKETITENMIQVMSAGTGLYHAEYNASETDDAHFLQIWIMPKEKGIPPKHKSTTISLQKNVMTKVVGGINDTTELTIHQDASLHLGAYTAETKETYTLPKGQGLFVFVIKGSIEILGETVSERDSIEITEESTIDYTVKEDSKILIIEVPVQNHSE